MLGQLYSPRASDDLLARRVSDLGADAFTSRVAAGSADLGWPEPLRVTTLGIQGQAYDIAPLTSSCSIFNA